MVTQTKNNICSVSATITTLAMESANPYIFSAIRLEFPEPFSHLREYTTLGIYSSLLCFGIWPKACLKWRTQASVDGPSTKTALRWRQYSTDSSSLVQCGRYWLRLGIRGVMYQSFIFCVLSEERNTIGPSPRVG